MYLFYFLDFFVVNLAVLSWREGVVGWKSLGFRVIVWKIKMFFLDVMWVRRVFY